MIYTIDYLEYTRKKYFENKKFTFINHHFLELNYLRMLLHAEHASNQGHCSIVLRTVDTDVVVIAVSQIQVLIPFSTNYKDKILIQIQTCRKIRIRI